MRHEPLGVPRRAAWVPTDDPSSRVGPLPEALLGGCRWAPSGLNALGHSLTVDITTGALTLAVTDFAAPYQQLAFEAARTFDAQEQHAQHCYLDSQPNTDPRVHLFGNWQCSREVLVAEAWQRTLSEILVGEGGGLSGLYDRAFPDFAVNTATQAQVEQRLRAFGVPGRTLAALGWRYEQFDSVLRTRRGPFSILAGSFFAETMVDPAHIRLCRFDPVTGEAVLYSSEFAYQQLIDAEGTREVTVQGLVVRSVDALGHAVTFRPVETHPPYRGYRLEDGSGRAINFALSERAEFVDGNRFAGRAAAYLVSRVMDDQSGNPINYRYDDGRLVEVLYPGHTGGDPRSVRYDYDAAGRLVRLTDPAGDTFAIDYVEDLYDTDDRLVPRLKISRLVDGAGNEARYAYDHAARTVTVTFIGASGDSQTVRYAYIEDASDTRQRFITSERIDVTRGFSGNQTVETRRGYSNDGRFLITAIADALGGTVRFDFNDFNQVTARTDAVGHVRSFAYDLRPAPTPFDPNRYDLLEVAETNVDINGNLFPVRSAVSYRRYDALTSGEAADSVQSTHRIETRTDPVGQISSFGYDEAGSFFPLDPTSFIDPLGHMSERAYDAPGAVVRDTDAVGSTSTMAYDAQGRMLARRDPNGFTHRWTYDKGSGWLTAATDALGAAPGDPDHSVLFKWTAAGQLLRQIDASGDEVEFAYGPDKRLRSVTRHAAAPRTLSFAYDATGSLTELHDPAGHVTFFEIDEAGRTYSTYRDSRASGEIRARFDAVGRCVEAIGRSGPSTILGYDAVGRLISAAAPVNPGKRVTIDYDRLGRRLRVADSELARPSVYAYDAAGNLARATETFGPSLNYVTDPNGVLIRLHDDEGIVDLRLGRDPAGHVASVSDSDWRDPGQTFRFVREKSGQVDNLYRIEATSGLVAQFSYDPNRRLTGTRAEAGGQTIADYGYAYRPDGLIGSTAGDRAGAYSYDGLKQLTGETDAGLASAYDPSGNRLWREASQPPPARFNTYNADNRLIRSGDATQYSFDRDGNLLLREPPAGEATQYIYDGASRLRRVGRGGLTIDYVYDFTGRLVERRRSQNGATALRGYIYANRSVLAALDEAGQPVDVYTRSDQGRLLRRRSSIPLDAAPARDPHSLYYVLDGLNSVIRLVARDGREMLSRSFDAWGRASDSGPAPEELFGYRGAFQDPDIELLQFGRRWYDPGLGRWLTEDPLIADVLVRGAAVWPSVKDLVNLYSYVSNNPLNWLDPGGLGIWNWIKTRAQEAAIAVGQAQQPDWSRGGQPKDTYPEQVRKKSPQTNEDESADHPDEYPVGAGEGSRAPSTQRDYARRERRLLESEGSSGVPFIVAGIVLWEVAKWTAAIGTAPVSGGTSLGLAAATP
jgi:RHS repeat-associated protein